MRRLLIIAAVAPTGCEDYEFAPEVDWPESFDTNLDNDDDDENIARLELEIPAEGEFDMQVTFDMSDADADVVRARLLVRNPFGLATRYDDCRIPGEGEELACVASVAADPGADTFEGLGYATISVTVAGEEITGDHAVEVWVVDRSNYASNHVHGFVTVFAPGSE